MIKAIGQVISPSGRTRLKLKVRAFLTYSCLYSERATGDLLSLPLKGMPFTKDSSVQRGVSSLKQHIFCKGYSVWKEPVSLLLFVATILHSIGPF